MLGLPPSMQSELQTNATPSGATAETRRSSHKVAEQKRRDSLKLCFDELRRILPPILPYTDEADRRPGDGNVGGQRHGEIDPENPNKGVSKVALLRRSNEYLDILRDRIDRRDKAISALRSHITQMRAQLGIEELGEEDEEVPGLDLDLDNIDKEEKQAGNLAFCAFLLPVHSRSLGNANSLALQTRISTLTKRCRPLSPEDRPPRAVPTLRTVPSPDRRLVRREHAARLAPPSLKRRWTLRSRKSLNEAFSFGSRSVFSAPSSSCCSVLFLHPIRNVQLDVDIVFSPAPPLLSSADPTESADLSTLSRLAFLPPSHVPHAGAATYMGRHARARRRDDSSDGDSTGSSSSHDSDDESTASSHDHLRREKGDKRDTDDSDEEDTVSEASSVCHSLRASPAQI